MHSMDLIFRQGFRPLCNKKYYCRQEEKGKIDCKLEFITGNDKARPGWIR